MEAINVNSHTHTHTPTDTHNPRNDSKRSRTFLALRTSVFSGNVRSGSCSVVHISLMVDITWIRPIILIIAHSPPTFAAFLSGQFSPDALIALKLTIALTGLSLRHFGLARRLTGCARDASKGAPARPSWRQKGEAGLWVGESPHISSL